LKQFIKLSTGKPVAFCKRLSALKEESRLNALIEGKYYI